MIDNAIESVLNQTYDNWELILVDDGSTDNTKDVVMEYTLRDPRIIYIYQDNGERSAARNNGIRNSSGNFVCFLDSDDSFENNHLQTLFQSISEERSPIGLFFTNFYEKKGLEKSINNTPLLKDFKNTVEYIMTYAIIPSRVCIHRKILENHQFDEDICVAEDVILWSKIAIHFPLIQINEPTVNYLIHEDNSINLKNNAATKRLKGLKIFFKRYPDVVQKLSKRKKRTLLSNTYFGISKYYIYNNQKTAALKAIIMSWLYAPIHFQNKHKFFLIYSLLLSKKTEYSK